MKKSDKKTVHSFRVEENVLNSILKLYPNLDLNEFMRMTLKNMTETKNIMKCPCCGKPILGTD